MVSNGAGCSSGSSSTIFGGGGGGSRSSFVFLPATSMGVGRQTACLSRVLKDKKGGDEIKWSVCHLVPFSQPTAGHSGMAASRSPTQTGQSSRAYPLKWIEAVFDSKERTESLLRPEVENGNVTYHDMELAQASEVLLLTRSTNEVTPRVFYSPSSRPGNAISRWVVLLSNCTLTHVRSYNRSGPPS